MANFVTGTRILCSMMILFCPVFSAPFYVFYIMAGITDMIDGTIARKTNSASKDGAKFDTVADIVFIAVCLFKLIPVMDIDGCIYWWVIFLVTIKVVNIVFGYVMQRKFIAVHSMMNKVTGALLFMLPLTLYLVELRYTAMVVCLVATFAAIQEGYYIIIKKFEFCKGNSISINNKLYEMILCLEHNHFDFVCQNFVDVGADEERIIVAIDSLC